MDKRKTKLVEKVISGLDWDSILEVNKCFKLGTGEGSTIIPGIKRKPFGESLSKNDLKNELKNLLKHVLENGISDFSYGPWLIYWTDSDWISFEGNIDFYGDQEEGEEGEDSSGIRVEIDSSLEVIYSPQRIFLISPSPKNENEKENSIVSDSDHLERMLKKALESEKYELASKIKDLISLQKGDLTEDK